MSLSEGVFPIAWKSAAITPVHKSGNAHDVKNYRAISILSCLPKVFESLIHDWLYPKVHHIISEWQHGFVQKRSTTTNMMSYVSSLIGAVGKRHQIDAIYIDFAKAFDKVPHVLLVEKLGKMGFPEWLTNWIRSYLDNRSAYVRIGGTKSVSFDVLSGVPQGSHLGPLLFVLFINDLCSIIQSHKRLFADDFKFYRVITSTVDCCALQDDIDLLLNWCELNGMVNEQKCSIISFCKNRRVTLFEYKMKSTCMNRVSIVKDLGVLLDNKLSLTQNVAAATSKAFAVLGFIRRNTQHFKDIYCLKSLYCALVRSILEYCVLVWAPYHAVHINRIEKIQRQFVRYALRLLPWNDPVNLPSYEHRCNLIGLPTLASRRASLQQLFVYDLLENNIDSPDLLGMLQFNVPPRSTRRNNFFRLPAHRTVFAANNPFEVCCRSFETVSDYYNSRVSRNNFKLRIRTIN